MKFSSPSGLHLLFLVLVAVVAAPPLGLAAMLAHEGGHGLLIVPAIVCNREIPPMPTGESDEWNPFQTFPAGIFLFFFSFPLGVVANGVLSFLSYKNAAQYKERADTIHVIFFVVFLSFCIMNFKSVLSNLFGQDFAFIWEGIHFPHESPLFRHLLKGIAYLGLPLVMKHINIFKALAISLGTFAGTYITAVVIFEPLLEGFMKNFWWLFICGLPVFIGLAGVLFWMASDNSKNCEVPPQLS